MDIFKRDAVTADPDAAVDADVAEPVPSDDEQFEPEPVEPVDEAVFRAATDPATATAPSDPVEAPAPVADEQAAFHASTGPANDDADAVSVADSDSDSVALDDGLGND